MRKKNLGYPARIEFCTDDGEYYLVGFPDFPGCLTQGIDINEAKENAKDALSLNIDYLNQEKIPLPKPSKLEGDNIYYIIPELGKSTSYSEYHKKSYEKNKEKVLSDKRKKELELQEQGYKNFREFIHKDTLSKLDKIVKEIGTTRRDFITSLIEEEYKNLHKVLK